MLLLSNAAAAGKEDKLFLEQAVRFEAQIIFLAMNVPGMVIGVVRDGESVVLGFGERAAGAGEPDGDTIIKIGSISKAAAGQVFAGLVADGTVHFADRLEERLGWKVPAPSLDGRPITLLDLATHASGLPREVEHVFRQATPDLISRADYESALGNQPLLFAPGTGLHYSNYGFDLLGEAPVNSAKRPYAQLLKEKVPEPAGMMDTHV